MGVAGLVVVEGSDQFPPIVLMHTFPLYGLQGISSYFKRLHFELHASKRPRGVRSLNSEVYPPYVTFL